jgi:hypothetical protein
MSNFLMLFRRVSWYTGIIQTSMLQTFFTTAKNISTLFLVHSRKININVHVSFCASEVNSRNTNLDAFLVIIITKFLESDLFSGK